MRESMQEEVGMIRISQLKLPIYHKEEDIKWKAAKLLRIPVQEIRSLSIVKQSVDARKKDGILFIYTVDVMIEKEDDIVHKARQANIVLHQECNYEFPVSGDGRLSNPPIIIGSGPAGLFCALMLARSGYRPIILERGDDVDTRTQKVNDFWRGGLLELNSNVQFGEGGAGTFSDGKLNTLVKDSNQRNRKVLELFVEFGADPSILYQNKPHIGTDVLSHIVKRMREDIIRLGGQVRFQSQVTDFLIEHGRLTGLVVGSDEVIDVDAVILAIGHSARDTFETLYRRQVPMQHKAFAVGLRIEHPQSMINLSQYGKERSDVLGAASYKLTKQTRNGRGVYSFCMCPGGYVVDASSEEKRLAINGMSNHKRDGENANSALIVTVTPEDFPDTTPLAGVAYQRKLEELAFQYGDGKIPVQLYGDFKLGKISTGYGDVKPQEKGLVNFSNLREMLPAYLSESLLEGMESFDHMIKGFGRYDAILTGIESRTSSPIRIERNDRLESEMKGLFPCGEGAGYAGGITSAAMDGIKVAEEIAKRYAPL